MNSQVRRVSQVGQDAGPSSRRQEFKPLTRYHRELNKLAVNASKLDRYSFETLTVRI